MSGFVKVIDDDKDNMIYINPAYIISVRPKDDKSFKYSGAVIMMQLGEDYTEYSIAAGVRTRNVLSALGISED